MKMGIERVLKEKFGDAVKDIVQVFDEQPAETTVEASLYLNCCVYKTRFMNGLIQVVFYLTRVS